MKRIITLFMALVMLAGLASCSTDSGNSERSRGRSSETTETMESKVDIEDLHSYEGPMFEITSTNDADEDNSMVLFYDGTINYSGGPNECLGYLQDEEYMTVYDFCIETVRNDTFADYHEDACDGATYRFVFYDEDGGSHVLYEGYIYQNEELNAIRGIFY